ncbi:SusC/RagA family TonB-linked outer membrane protein [Pedobacter endophyticus]|uniref:SusC/RagA family TonB-linked outer membrane protein n=1 Tax=Pedobacter endophyticus TaxID=2789740 RepID=A0A7S9Q018_9SPHI|nr:SusC/RagA family TonB-linked outer membrane protein [Pedobacter endophyticus]QPH40237.1 SusC/RagA family TonB-linked outer membrane protein [Pedobacter endophyticus]
MNIKILIKISMSLLLLLVASTALFAQDRKVTGKVVDQADGQGIPGVNVSLKGVPSNVSTNGNGEFTIQVRSNSDVLVFSYIGYIRQQVTVGTQTNIAVKLVSENNDLEDVVIVGYGTQKKASLTAAISQPDLKKVEDVPALSLSAVLRGTMPGVTVGGGVQRPGQAATITVRNPTVLSKDSQQGTNPIYVIDDVVRSQQDFEQLDQSMVESISVLKDAEAAIFGVSGSNGVVLVRTKRGRTGAPRINFSSTVGFSNATKLPELMSGLQLGNYVNDYLNASVYAQTASGTPNNNYINADGYRVINGVPDLTRQTQWYTPDELEYFTNNNHNWLKEAFQTSTLLRNAVNISGGTDKVTYFIGGDYVTQNSNFKGINSDKYGLRASIEAKLSKRLTVSGSISGDVNSTKSYFYKLNSTSESLDNDVASLQNVNPWSEYYINGNPVILGSSNTGGLDNVNFFLVQNSDNFTGGKRYNMNFLGKVTYDIPGVKGLQATFTGNKNINSTNNKQFGTTFTYYKYAGEGANNHIPGGALLGTYTIKNGDRVRLNPVFAENYQLNAGFNYNRSFGKHNISALALVEQRESSSEGVAAMTEGVVAGGLPYQTFTVGTQTSTQSSQLSQDGFQSVISRINYDYDNKYLLQLVYRADGSAKFSPGNNWGSFPAASVGWVISEENFFKDNVKWIDFLKFRANVGLTGTDATKAYQFLRSYNLGTGSSGGAVFNEADRTIAIKTNVAIPNDAVVWDHALKTNYGFDMQLLGGKLSLSGDYFWNHNYDMLATLQSSVSFLIGAAVPTENYGEVNNFGYEFSATWKDKIGDKFTYSFSPFYTWNDNKIIKYDIASGKVGTLEDLTGQSSDAGYFAYKSLGIIRTQADADAIIAQRAAAAGGANKVKILDNFLQPGMINYEDVNGDGMITVADKKYVTNRQNNHNNLGLNFSLGYGPINVNVIAGLSWGGYTSIGGLKASGNGSTVYNNRASYWVDHWTPTNTNAAYPNPYFSSALEDSDFWLVSATQLGITNANVSYTVPNKLTSKIGINSIRVFAQATNPVQFINPFPNNYRDFLTPMGAYPTLRTISFGLNVGL